MRLLVAERPERRQFGKAGELRVFRHDRDGIARADDEEIEGKRSADRIDLRSRRGDGETSIGAGEVERAVRLMNEHRPAARADQPLDWHAPAVRAQLIAALTVAHPIGRAAAIELRSAFAEAEDRAVAERERQRAGLLIDTELLNEAAVRMSDRQL